MTQLISKFALHLLQTKPFALAGARAQAESGTRKRNSKQMGKYESKEKGRGQSTSVTTSAEPLLGTLLQTTLPYQQGNQANVQGEAQPYRRCCTYFLSLLMQRGPSKHPVTAMFSHEHHKWVLNSQYAATGNILRCLHCSMPMGSHVLGSSRWPDKRAHYLCSINLSYIGQPQT